MSALLRRIFFVTGVVLGAVAAEQPGAVSEHFAILHRTIDSGGGSARSSRFEVVASINSATGESASSASFTDRQGFIGQLNEFPVLLADQFVSRPGRPLKILRSNLLANDSDVENEDLQFVSIPATSANGVPLLLVDDWILYNAGPNNTATDSFTYVVTDGIDEATGTVFLTNTPFEGITFNIAIVPQGADNLLRVFGIPGRAYQIQTTASLTPPISWSNLGAPEVAPANGLIQRTDVAPPAARFYRAIEP